MTIKSFNSHAQLCQNQTNLRPFKRLRNFIRSCQDHYDPNQIPTCTVIILKYNFWTHNKVKNWFYILEQMWPDLWFNLCLSCLGTFVSWKVKPNTTMPISPSTVSHIEARRKEIYVAGILEKSSKSCQIIRSKSKQNVLLIQFFLFL